jgi:hypothetical protein
MSVPGIQSSRGDSYQTMVALDWALSVLSDPEYQWLEVDSVHWPIDDVVVGNNDGSLICCQCKKNQPNSTNWSISDLSDEIAKAGTLLSTNANAQVRFYSHSPFGALAGLQEYCSSQPDEESFLSNIAEGNRRTNERLTLVLRDTISSYTFLCRTFFTINDSFDRMKAVAIERLRNITSNPCAAYDALWTRLDQLCSRLEGTEGNYLAIQHRLAKEDIRELLNGAGAIISQAKDCVIIRESFAATSAIGRSWTRDIAGRRLTSPILNELLVSIRENKRSILLSGQPGSGKTCVLLALQEELETQARLGDDVVPIFIQSREYADVVTAQEREAQGLPVDWVEMAARMADEAHVVVIVDSLDVLSIAREHGVLGYFLAQIDRLLRIPNTTIVAACRDFDRHYDRRISVRKWDCELNCRPLEWETQVAPLLRELGIDLGLMDASTRELVQNPRELALFVDLARKEGGFSVVTSQALAQRYLDTVVRREPALGEPAMMAIEAMAAEMLNRRSLSIPAQRFAASSDILRVLLSQRVFLGTDDGKLTFGHQTLIDVVAISGALRSRLSLSDFIRSLPPVPFIRPSIRSYIAQLTALGRREFIKQIRPVLMGNMAFHIRRLAAESIAEYPPEQGDWPLLRELREDRRDVFQVIYQRALSIEWHRFWLKYLMPYLKASRDAEGITAHAYCISRWLKDDPDGVVGFWIEILKLDWTDRDRIVGQLHLYLSDIPTDRQPTFIPLVKILLTMPRPEYGMLGKLIAQSVSTGVIGDDILWDYIAGDIAEDDLLYELSKKLHCQPHDFGNDEHFLAERMQKSTDLLDLVLSTIETWGKKRAERFGISCMSYQSGFLSSTSYEDAHSVGDLHFVEGGRALFDAIELAIRQHAIEASRWWLNNKRRLGASADDSLRYFAILAVSDAPEANTDLIADLLCNSCSLESYFTYELGSLMQKAFIYLDQTIQGSILDAITSIHASAEEEPDNRFWILEKRAQLISAVPCHLRSQETQEILDEYESIAGTMFRLPEIRFRGGWVAPPFNYQVFLDIPDSSILPLLQYYEDHPHGYDLVGGADEVGHQLEEAASRHPARFIALLSEYWSGLGARFRDDIMRGAANHLAYRFRSQQRSNGWKPVEEPASVPFVNWLIGIIERHPSHWQHNRSASEAIQACSYVVEETASAERLVFLALGFTTMQEEERFNGVGYLTAGINMARGRIADAMMTLANRFLERNITWPELLAPTLRRLAGDVSPAIRAVILQHLPYLQSRLPDLGWTIFDSAMQEPEGLWGVAGTCLYYTYYRSFDHVGPVLNRLRSEGTGEDLETWGRITALAALGGQVEFAPWLLDMQSLGVCDAWKGAAAVWSHPGNIEQHREQCFEGLEAGLISHKSSALAVAENMAHIFRTDEPFIAIPIELLKLYFASLATRDESKRNEPFNFFQWLNLYAQTWPEEAMSAAEIYLDYVKDSRLYVYDYENNLTQFLTRVFAAAEEREESDCGVMLERVVALQDSILALGVRDIDEWLRAAERP